MNGPGILMEGAALAACFIMGAVGTYLAMTYEKRRRHK